MNYHYHYAIYCVWPYDPDNAYIETVSRDTRISEVARRTLGLVIAGIDPSDIDPAVPPALYDNDLPPLLALAYRVQCPGPAELPCRPAQWPEVFRLRKPALYLPHGAYCLFANPGPAPLTIRAWDKILPEFMKGVL